MGLGGGGGAWGSVAESLASCETKDRKQGEGREAASRTQLPPLRKGRAAGWGGAGSPACRGKGSVCVSVCVWEKGGGGQCQSPRDELQSAVVCPTNTIYNSLGNRTEKKKKKKSEDAPSCNVSQFLLLSLCSDWPTGAHLSQCFSPCVSCRTMKQRKSISNGKIY